MHFLENVYFRCDHREKTLTSCELVLWARNDRKVTARGRGRFVARLLQYICEKMAPSRILTEVSYSILRPQNFLMSFRQAIYKALCNEPIYSHNPGSYQTSIRVIKCLFSIFRRLPINIYIQIIEDLGMKAVITNAMQPHVKMLCISVNSVHCKWILRSDVSYQERLS